MKEQYIAYYTIVLLEGYSGPMQDPARTKRRSTLAAANEINSI